MRFAGAHVFMYSPRTGTAAVNLQDHVPTQAARDRSARVRKIVAESGYSYRVGFLGTTMPVLWEKTHPTEVKGWHLSGLTDNYIRVQSNSRSDLQNQISLVRLVEMEGEMVRGELLL
jgi:tRNA A37 methylthiotransferase MiaB